MIYVKNRFTVLTLINNLQFYYIPLFAYSQAVVTIYGRLYSGLVKCKGKKVMEGPQGVRKWRKIPANATVLFS